MNDPDQARSARGPREQGWRSHAPSLHLPRAVTAPSDTPRQDLAELIERREALLAQLPAQNWRGVLGPKPRVISSASTQAEEKIRHRLARSDNISARLLEQMTMNEDMNNKVSKCITELQRASGAMFTSLSVVEKRLDVREQLSRDATHSALEKERGVLLGCRETLTAAIKEGKDLLENLEEVGAEMIKDRLVLPHDRSDRPDEVLKKSQQQLDVAMTFVGQRGKAAHVLKKTRADAAQALQETKAAILECIAEKQEMRRQLEVEIEVTDVAIKKASQTLHEAKRQHASQQLQDMVVQESSASDEAEACSMTASSLTSSRRLLKRGVNFKYDAKTKGVDRALAKLRSKIKAAAYTGQSGRQISVLFHRITKDCNHPDLEGKMTEEQLHRAVRRTFRVTQSVVTDAELVTLFDVLDADHGGEKTGFIRIDDLVEALTADSGAIVWQERVDTAMNVVQNLRKIKRDLMQLLSDKAWEVKIEKECLQVTPIKGLELDGIPSPQNATLSLELPCGTKRVVPLSGHAAQEVRAKIQGAQPGQEAEHLVGLFARFCQDGSDRMQEDHVRKVLRQLLLIPASDISDQQISALCSLLDPEGHGFVKLSDVAEFIASHEAARASNAPPAATPRTLATTGSKQWSRAVAARSTGMETSKELWRSSTGKVKPLKADALDRLRTQLKLALSRGPRNVELFLLFNPYDRGFGTVTEEDVLKVVRRTLKIPRSVVADELVLSLCRSLDTDKSGVVSIADFVSFLSGESEQRETASSTCLPEMGASDSTWSLLQDSRSPR